MQRIIINGREVDLDTIAKTTKDSSKDTTPKERQETFVGNALTISDLFADIDIQPSRQNEITISVTGPEDIVDRLTIKEKGGTVMVKGQANNSVSIIQCGGINICNGSITKCGSGGVTIISGGNVSINTGDVDVKLSVKITAPKHTEINLSDIDGNVVIGDLESNMDLDLSGKSYVYASSVQDLTLDSSGACKVIVERIAGDADLDLSGSCKVELQSGSIDKLKVDVSGTCKADVQAIARRANLDASGVSSIYVREVTGRCHKDRSGMASILVGGGGK